MAEKKTTGTAKKLNSVKGTYKVSQRLNLRADAGMDQAVLEEMPAGAAIESNGYYKEINGERWIRITAVAGREIKGYCMGKYLQKA